MASSAVHSETITYREQPIDLHYSASVVINTQPKGVHAPLRGMERSCHWNAKLIIERRIGASASPLRRLPVAKQVSGTAHGPCHSDSSQVKRAPIKHWVICHWRCAKRPVTTAPLLWPN
jgi:hypothetical protein